MLRYKNMLVGVDFRQVGDPDAEIPTTDSQEAVARASMLAKLTDARLTFAHTFPASTEVRRHLEAAGDASGTILAAAERALQKLVGRAAERGLEADTRFLYGRSWEALVACAENDGFDLVVLGTRQQRGFRRALFGSTAHRVMVTCNVPVLIAHHQPLRNFERTVIATDASELGTEVLRHGLSFAHVNGSKVEVVHGVENWFEGRWERAGLARATIEREHEEEKRTIRAQLEASVAGLVEELGVEPPVVRVETGEPEEVIWHAASGTKTDLVVMGVASRSGLQRLWVGNTAERILPELPCSLLTVHPGAAAG